MKKRLISTITAVICAASAAAVPAFGAGSRFGDWGTISDGEPMAELLDGFTQVDEFTSEYGVHTLVFVNTERENLYLYLRRLTPYLVVTSDIPMNELTSIAQSVDSELTVKAHTEGKYKIWLNNCADPKAAARKIGAALRAKDGSISAEYLDTFSYQKGSTTGRDALDYEFAKNGKNAEIPAILEKYVKENAIDVTVKTESYRERSNISDSRLESYYETAMYCTLIPNSPMTPKEKYDLARKISADTGIQADVLCPTDVVADEVIAGRIEMCSSVAGDVNCDGEVTIADAAAILQSLGSRELYRLSPQGEFNADVSGGFDGITVKDALEIQKFKAGLVESLG